MLIAIRFYINATGGGNVKADLHRGWSPRGSKGAIGAVVTSGVSDKKYNAFSLYFLSFSHRLLWFHPRCSLTVVFNFIKVVCKKL